MNRPIIPLLPALLALAACAAPPPPPSGQARADAAVRTACREHADAVYERQNRDTIYTISSRDTPYSANYTPGVMDKGLSQLYARDNMVRDCIRNTGTETDRTQPEAPGTAPTQP
jgi:hypothetical protein